MIQGGADRPFSSCTPKGSTDWHDSPQHCPPDFRKRHQQTHRQVADADGSPLETLPPHPDREPPVTIQIYSTRKFPNSLHKHCDFRSFRSILLTTCCVGICFVNIRKKCGEQAKTPAERSRPTISANSHLFFAGKVHWVAPAREGSVGGPGRPRFVGGPGPSLTMGFP